MAIFRRCPNCQQLYQGKLCKGCANKKSKERPKNNEALKLYGSATWKKCRRNVLIRYHEMDIWMLGIGIVERCPETHVHHIYERDERPDLIYDIDNLITVSRDSHAEIHEWYAKDKRAAIARIKKGILKFKEMYGDDD